MSYMYNMLVLPEGWYWCDLVENTNANGQGRHAIRSPSNIKFEGFPSCDCFAKVLVSESKGGEL